MDARRPGIYNEGAATTKRWKDSLNARILETESNLADICRSGGAPSPPLATASGGAALRTNPLGVTRLDLDGEATRPASSIALLDRVLSSEKTVQDLATTVSVLREQRTAQDAALSRQQGVSFFLSIPGSCLLLFVFRLALASGLPKLDDH